MTEHGHFHWNELMSWDLEKAKKFYAETLGWTYSEMPMQPEGIYTLIMDGETPVGGMFEMNEEMHKGVPEHWGAYIAVDDVDARLEKAKAAGAEVVNGPFDAPGVGRIAMVKDVTGAILGWMTPEPQHQS